LSREARSKPIEDALVFPGRMKGGIFGDWPEKAANRLHFKGLR
jgi:uncharacterized protein (DUF1501 family)